MLAYCSTLHSLKFEMQCDQISKKLIFDPKSHPRGQRCVVSVKGLLASC